MEPRAGLGAVGLAAQAVWAVIATVSVLAGQRLAILLRPLIAALARPNIGGPIALAGAIALGSGIGRYRGAGLDGEALITLGIGVALLIAALPLLSSLTGIGMPAPSLARSAFRPASRGLRLAIAVVAGGVAWFASGAKTNLAGLTGQLPLVGGSKPLQGRAEALGGDLVRVAGTTVRLAGIEAPERQQVCGAGGRRYQCGAAAQAALGRLVNGRALSCTLSGTDAAGRPLASCTRGTTDINGELVRQGHVFAASGLFASYAAWNARRAPPRPASGSAGRPSVPRTSGPRYGRRPSAARPRVVRSRGW